MKKIIEKQNVSLYEVARCTGLMEPHLYYYTKPDTKIGNISVSNLLKLANYFKMEPMQLYKEMVEYHEKHYAR